LPSKYQISIILFFQVASKRHIGSLILGENGDIEVKKIVSPVGASGVLDTGISFVMTHEYRHDFISVYLWHSLSH
jgi:hypothetical protein